jgi:hypothetical protein
MAAFEYFLGSIRYCQGISKYLGQSSQYSIGESTALQIFSRFTINSKFSFFVVFIMSSAAVAPNANNTSTHYYKGFYWCINSRGTLYTLPFDGHMLQGKLTETYKRLGRLKTINWSSTFAVGGRKASGLILGVSPEEGKAAPAAATDLNDSFDAKDDSPTYYLLDETQFFDFSDHLQGGDLWARCDVITAAHTRATKSKNGWKKNQGKWLKDIFKGEALKLTDPPTPMFGVPAGDQELQEEVDNIREMDSFFVANAAGTLLIRVGILVVVNRHQ